MAKTTSINLRISPEFRKDIEQLANYHGLSMSSYAHSLLVRAIRKEKEGQPEAFGDGLSDRPRFVADQGEIGNDAKPSAKKKAGS